MSREWQQQTDEQQRRDEEERQKDWDKVWNDEPPPWIYWDRVKEYWNDHFG